MTTSLPTLPGSFARRAAMWCALLIVGVSAAHASGPSRWATLEAIHQLENPRNLTRPGPFGELGAYQFRSMTWKMHTTAPFEKALDRQTSDVIAVQHYEWLKRGLLEAKLPVTPYNIALAWNGGLSGVVGRTAPRAAHDYASRVVNLAATLDNRVADAR